MIRTPELWVKFYEALAFLFYGIATSDGEVRKQEVAVVKKSLQDTWLHFESSLDEYGYDAAYQIEAVFDWLCDTEPSAASAFKKFRSFVEEYPAFVDQSLKRSILDSANRIASSYAGRNKSELSYLYQLEEVLKG